MKRIAAIILAWVLTVSTAVCWAIPPAYGEADMAPPVQKSLFLKVSSITFSLVGESDDIYLGLVPRELVSWESEDPGIVSVEGGVLTAKGVGTTTIRATYNDRQVSCAASCLAQTQEELTKLDPEILSAPKRLPPEVDLNEPCTFYDDSVMIGDSITYFLWQFESMNDHLGQMAFVSRQGVSLHSLVNRSKNMYYEGHEMYIEDIIASVGASRVYILLGCLDFQVPASTLTLMDHWQELFDKIQEKAPEKEIVIISNIPGYSALTIPTKYNRNVAEAAPKLRQLAVERGYGYLDLGYYVEDHYGRMPQSYSKDEFHMNSQGNLVWTEVLRFYALFESEGGSLLPQIDS